MQCQMLQHLVCARRDAASAFTSTEANSVDGHRSVPKTGTFPSYTIALGLAKPPAEDRCSFMLRSCKTEASANDGLGNCTEKAFLK